MWTPAILLLTAAGALAFVRPLAVLLDRDDRSTKLAPDHRSALARLWERHQTCPACTSPVVDLSSHLAAVHPVNEAVLDLHNSAKVDFVLIERHPSSSGTR